MSTRSCGCWSRVARPGTYAILIFFFFQAEDGIRDLTVTGVQTCALPISFRFGDDGFGLAVSDPADGAAIRAAEIVCGGPVTFAVASFDDIATVLERRLRSEERRVGEEGRSRWSPDH